LVIPDEWVRMGCRVLPVCLERLVAQAPAQLALLVRKVRPEMQDLQDLKAQTAQLDHRAAEVHRVRLVFQARLVLQDPAVLQATRGHKATREYVVTLAQWGQTARRVRKAHADNKATQALPELPASRAQSATLDRREPRALLARAA